jgi:quercetin dioxygenase-like cupin family protein
MVDTLRDRGNRHRRLDEQLVHVFPAKEFGDALRDEADFERHHHGGLTLMKTRELRVVLQVADAGVVLANHVVHGPATLYLMEGELEVETDGGRYFAGEGDMVVLPRAEERQILSRKRSLFLLALAPES